jgi:hypothetical protein
MYSIVYITVITSTAYTYYSRIYSFIIPKLLFITISYYVACIKVNIVLHLSVIFTIPITWQSSLTLLGPKVYDLLYKYVINNNNNLFSETIQFYNINKNIQSICWLLPFKHKACFGGLYTFEFSTKLRVRLSKKFNYNTNKHT